MFKFKLKLKIKKIFYDNMNKHISGKKVVKFFSW